MHLDRYSVSYFYTRPCEEYKNFIGHDNLRRFWGREMAYLHPGLELSI